jgi:ubiquinone/menaquinone biosynthesis methyltransferase
VPQPETAAKLVAAIEARSDELPRAGHALAVQRMFDRIAPTYDLLNRLLSFGIDRRWRTRALDVVEAHAPSGPLFDGCAGTLDLAAAMQARFPERTLIAGDFARDMLLRGRGKPARPVQSLVCDAMRLPLASDAFAAITCGFGLRNLSDPERGLAEALRVLRPDGVLVVLELFRPTRVPTRVFHALYARGVLPLVGSLVSGDREAYRYLSDSMQGFLTRDELCERMRRVGFRQAHAFDLTLGIASVVWGRK